MLQPLLNGTTLPLLKQVAKFAERRQEVLAGNVANFDTPGYRMRDLPVDDFQRALEVAIARRKAGPAVGETTLSLHQPAAPQSPVELLQDLFPESLFQADSHLEQDHITFQDANNRSIEHQFLAMTKNSILQQFALEVMRGQFDQLQTVISERS
jgi:flagellar basal-body rod protein FlgB